MNSQLNYFFNEWLGQHKHLKNFIIRHVDRIYIPFGVGRNRIYTNQIHCENCRKEKAFEISNAYIKK